MKNLIFPIVVMLTFLGLETVQTQTVVVKFLDGQTVEYDVTQIESISFKQADYVDLGLPSGTLWATCNVGASSPEDYGDFFAWGETKPKEEYIRDNYFDFYDGDYQNYTLTGFYEPLPENDAATANWGRNREMPSKEQLEELFNSDFTITEKTTINDVNGLQITSRSNGESIFLPAAGRFLLSKVFNGTLNCYYWSRSLSDSYFDCGCYLYLQSGTFFTHGSDRCQGQSVRPVRKQ